LAQPTAWMSVSYSSMVGSRSRTWPPRSTMPWASTRTRRSPTRRAGR
jgi:hypothetical protein